MDLSTRFEGGNPLLMPVIYERGHLAESNSLNSLTFYGCMLFYKKNIGTYILVIYYLTFFFTEVMLSFI